MREAAQSDHLDPWRRSGSTEAIIQNEAKESERYHFVRGGVTMKYTKRLLLGALALQQSLVTAAAATKQRNLQQGDTTGILNGRYKFTTNVDNVLDLSLDVRDMIDASDVGAAKSIFETGANADAPGGTGALWSLSSLGKDADTKQPPHYSFFKHFLRRIDALAGGTLDVGHYGTTVVQKIFAELQNNMQTSQLEDAFAAEQVVAGIFWMQHVRYLYQAHDACRAQDVNGVAQNLDSAVAIYVGRDQLEGDGEAGYTLYTAAERMAVFFGTDKPANNGEEAQANTHILNLYSDMQTNFVTKDACSKHPEEAHKRFRVQINRIIAQSTVQLFQHLIHYMSTERGYEAELYAIQLSPLVGMCDAAGSELLQDLMVTKAYNANSFDGVMEIITRAYGCVGITCADVGAYETDVVNACDDPEALTPIAGYTPIQDVREQNKLDRDLLQLSILLLEGDTDNAKDHLNFGFNSHMEDQYWADIYEPHDWNHVIYRPHVYRTIRDLSADPEREVVPTFGQYKAYFENNANYAYTFILDALSGDGAFEGNGVSKRQKIAGVVSAVKFLVTYMSSLQSMYEAVELCRAKADLPGGGGTDDGTLEAMSTKWDAAVAYTVGSIEGQDQNGSLNNDGQLMFSIGKELCTQFSTCDNAKVIIDAFEIGRDALTSADCDNAEGAAEDIESLLLTFAVQDVLSLSTTNEKLTESSGYGDASLVRGYVASLAFLPRAQADASGNAGNVSVQQAVNVIQKNMQYPPPNAAAGGPVPDGSDSVFQAVATLVPLIGEEVFDCDALGHMQGKPTLCSMSLLGYVPTTGIANTYMKYSDDVRDIKTASTTEEARSIFKGEKNGSGETLSSLSMTADTRMADEPLYSMYLYALSDLPPLAGSGNGDLTSSNARTIMRSKIASYGDSIVTDIFDELENFIGDQKDNAMAATAIVISIVWMEVVHHLYQAVSRCENGNTEGLGQSLDIAVAMYVGSDQEIGDAGSGHLLYNLAEKMALKFGQANEALGTSECQVNSRVMSFLLDIQEDFVKSGRCDSVAGAHKDLLAVVNKIVNTMKVPLVQGLIQSMREGWTNYADLYALVVSPLMATCNFGEAMELQKNLVEVGYKPEMFDSSLASLQESYGCMGLSCQAVGTYDGGTVPACDLDLADENAQHALQPFQDVSKVLTVLDGTYTTVTDVRDYFRITRDISDVASAPTTADARQIYENGRNVVVPAGNGQGGTKTVTLASISKNAATNYANEPYFDAFVQSMSAVAPLTSDGLPAEYGNIIVTDIFTDLEGPLGEVKDNHMAAEAIIVTIVWMEVVHLLTDAVDKCQSGASMEVMATIIDKAAALYVGVNQGYGDSTDGSSLYRLEEYTAAQFGTSENGMQSQVNGRIMSLFNTLKNKFALTKNACSNSANSYKELQSSANNIIDKMKVPLVRGLLSNLKMKDVDYSELYALQVSPILSRCDAAGASEIQEKLVLNVGSYQETMFGDVLTVLQRNYDCMGITCADIGAYNGGEIPQCGEDTAKTVSHSLAGYTPTTSHVVSGWLKLSEDVKDLRDAVDSKTAQSIFRNSGNAAVMPDGTAISLAFLSENAATRMSKDPLYNMQQYALSDVVSEYGKGDDIPSAAFGEIIVTEIFDELTTFLGDVDADNMAGEAALLMVVWMEVVHALYEAVRQCEVGSVDGVAESLDSAVALYVGAHQVIGDPNSGYMLYNLAERLSDPFGKDTGVSDECDVNQNVMDGFIEAQKAFVKSTACEDNGPKSALLFLDEVNKIVNKMKIPVVQGLIGHMAEGAKNYADLYGMAVTPLVATCNHTFAMDLRSQLVVEGFDDEMLGSLLWGLQDVYGCMGISCEEVGAYDTVDGETVEQCSGGDSGTSNPYPDVLRVHRFLDGAYITLTDVDQYILLTNDIHDIAEASSTEDALDIYQNGRNTGFSSDGTKLTLASLSVNAKTEYKGEPYFSAFVTYLQDVEALTEDGKSITRYADTIVLDIFEELAQELGAQLDDQMAAEAVIVTVIWMEVVHLLTHAITKCEAGAKAEEVAILVDGAAALYIGAEQNVGDETTGSSLYRLSEFMSNAFSTRGETSSHVNENVIDMLNWIKSRFLLSDACEIAPEDASEDLADVVEDIIKAMKVPIVQGLIANMKGDDDDDDDVDYTELYALQLTPLLAVCDEKVAAEVQLKLVTSATPFDDGMFGVVLSEIQSLYSCLGVTCAGVGAYKTDVVPQCQDLGGLAGYYPSTGVADELMGLSLDIRDMISAGNSTEARQIFEQGKNAVFNDGDGNLMSLMSLSTMAQQKMEKEPYYNIFIYSLNDVGALKTNAKIEEYGKTIVTDVFEELEASLGDGEDSDMAAEATVLIVLWMEVVHRLYVAVSECEDGNSLGVAEALDGAVALYVGAEQKYGDADTGYALYNHAERVAESFSQGSRHGNEACQVNRHMMSLFNDIQENIVSTDACGKDPEEQSKFLLSQISEIVNTMKVPLVQGLIKALKEEKANRAELYALQVTPLIAMCDYEVSMDMQVKLVMQEFQDSSFEGILTDLQNAYSCMGISCKEVGAYNRGEVAECKDSVTFDMPQPFTDVLEVEPFLKGAYVTVTDVRNYLRITHDIRDIAYASTTAEALDIYENGLNAVNPDGSRITLASFSQKAGSAYKDEPYFSAFTKSLSNIEPLTTGGRSIAQYADTIVRDIFEELPEDMGVEQDDHMAAEGIIVTVVWMEIVHLLTQTIRECELQNDVENIAALIDRAVALYVGVDQEVGDEETGSSLYRVEEFMAKYFGDSDASSQSKINSDILSTFNDIKKNFLLTDACFLYPSDATERLQGQVDKIINKMKVTMIRGLIANMKQDDEDYSELYALQVSPLLSVCDTSAAKVMEEQLILSEESVLADVFDDVVSELQGAYVCMGVSCSDVGTYNFQGTKVEQCSDASVEGSFAGYVPLTDVLSLARIANDVADMRSSESSDEAMSIYEDGRNAVDTDGSKISLSSFSTRAEMNMGDQLYHNIFKSALRRIGPFTADDHFMGEYAHTIVTDAFSELEEPLGDPENDSFAADAVVSFHVWMEVVRRLYDGVLNCELGSTEWAAEDIDSAVALYVGTGQRVGDATTGYLLYNFAEKVAIDFGTDQAASGQSVVNENVMSLFNEIKQTFLETTACVNDPEGPSALHVMVNRIIQQMTVPLVQNLIANMHRKRVDHVELYALAVTPLVSMCSPSTSRYIQDKLILSSHGYRPSMFDDVLEQLQSSYECMGITCADVGSFQMDPNEKCKNPAPMSGRSIAGYDHSTGGDTEQILKMDLDLLQIGILLREGAYRAAKKLINRGQNSLKQGGNFDSVYLSVQQLATDQSRSKVPTFVNYTQYFGDDENYALQLITDVLDGEEPYDDASDEQVTGIVEQALQSMVMYMSSLQFMYDAVEMCTAGSGESTTKWDNAVASFVGSIEGTEIGGNFEDDGKMMYALAKTSCHMMHSCDEDGNSILNNKVMDLFAAGKARLQKKNCNVAGNIARNVESLYQTILIQNTLRYTLHNAELEGGSGSGDVGRGFVLAEGIAPIIQSRNPDAAAVIDTNLRFSTTGQPVFDGSDAVFEAFVAVIPSLTGVDCALVGYATYVDVNVGVCPANDGDENTFNPGIENLSEASLDTDESHGLSNGLYQTSTYVENWAKIGTDVMNIEQSLQAGNVNIAKNIYAQGLNSDRFDEKGMLMTKKNFIAEFSLSAKDVMSQEITFNTFRYALQDEYGYFAGEAAEEYAHTFVKNAFDNTLAPTLASEGIVALIIWMQVVHELNAEAELCKASSAEAKTTMEDRISGIDRAAALILGDTKSTGEPSTGHLIYAMNQEMGEFFGQVSTGQAQTNFNIIKLLNRAKTEVTFPNACTPRSETYPRLRVLVDDIVSQMTVPLVQGLIHYMKKNDPYRVQLYALAVVPLIAGCNEAKFSYLKRLLIDTEYTNIMFGEVLTLLQSTYSCLGITCEDVGEYKGGVVAQCENPELLTALAGYRPVSDVREQSKIDLDILQMRILMTTGAYDAAMDLYQYGRNSRRGLELQTLQKMSRHSRRKNVPEYAVYSRYYEDDDWADTMILHVFNEKPPFDYLSPVQKTEIVVAVLRTMTMHMYALERLYDTLADCESGDPERNAFGVTAWDEMAASLIGSIEGTETGGTTNQAGQLMFDLAKETCVPTGTCTSSGDARVNDKLLIMLYAGQGELAQLQCDALRKTVSRVDTLLKVTLLQASLEYVARLDGTTANDKNGEYAKGYVYTKAVLPFINNVANDVAFILEQNMDFEKGQNPVFNGAPVIFKAVADALTKIPEISCTDVGSINGLDVCTATTYGVKQASAATPSTRSSSVLSFISISAGFVMLLGVLEW